VKKPFLLQVVFGGLNIIFKKRKEFFQRLLDLQAVEVVFDPALTSFETLAKHFFEIHNPALVKKESDKRSQYRSSVFYCNDEQKMIAKRLIEILKGKNYEVGTEITKAGMFYKAEEYHQSYYDKKGKVDYGYRYKEKF
jgi:peptide methionine sulfoxide reductase msrA/msrB